MPYPAKDLLLAFVAGKSNVVCLFFYDDPAGIWLEFENVSFRLTPAHSVSV